MLLKKKEQVNNGNNCSGVFDPSRYSDCHDL